jgi:hypothetical protein
MHFLVSLTVLLGFVFVICLGLVKIIWDLSEMSAHAPPYALPEDDMYFCSKVSTGTGLPKRYPCISSQPSDRR